MYPLEENGGIVAQQVVEQFCRASARDNIRLDRKLAHERAVAGIVKHAVGHLVELRGLLPVVLVGMQIDLTAGVLEGLELVVDVDYASVVGGKGYL